MDIINKKSVFDPQLSDNWMGSVGLSLDQATQVNHYFAKHPLFNWRDIHNCEDRAEAISILLTHWQIPHFKAWVFSGYFLNRNMGSLKNKWNYHVAVMLPIAEEATILAKVIDPTHSENLENMEEWANTVTLDAQSHYLVKQGHIYIFPVGQIRNENWHHRNRQNYKWTMQGLAGINGVSTKGKAAVTFNKFRIANTMKAFQQLQKHKPFAF